MDSPSKTVLLFSGGLDSTVALFYLKSLGHEVRCLSIDYGQRHKRELVAAKEIAAYTNTSFLELDLSTLIPIISESSQTNSNIEVPDGHYTEMSMKATVVPNRNMMMLSAAIAYAVNLKWDSVAYAAHAGDHTIYPDCRPEFINAMKEAAALCDWHPIQLLAPFSTFTKSEIVTKGLALDVPFSLTWSCYKGGQNHCGKCGTCVERIEAFKNANLLDPTKYD